jgi:UPF0176 protein
MKIKIMQIRHLAGYQFISLNALETLRESFLTQCQTLRLKGTILLSAEGINLSLAGESNCIEQFKKILETDSRFSKIFFHENETTCQPFKRLKIKIKREIIAFRKSHIHPTQTRAASISPELLKQWLDEKREITLLDVRNEYEIKLGTFAGALNLHLNHFCDFPEASTKVAQDKPIVMFCTGGIRCEKAALYMQDQGCANVFQLEGGILNYFKKTNGAHYEGSCFVFDERVVVK